MWYKEITWSIVFVIKHKLHALPSGVITCYLQSNTLLNLVVKRSAFAFDVQRKCQSALVILFIMNAAGSENTIMCSLINLSDGHKRTSLLLLFKSELIKYFLFKKLFSVGCKLFAAIRLLPLH